MILIADSGSSKTDWKVIGKDGEIKSVSTTGINPVHQDFGFIYNEFTEKLIPEIGTEILQIFFYGAGCTPEKAPVVKEALEKAFSKAKVEVYDDLLAVARALCGHEKGIACILGTGSNSCLYDGEKIIDKVPALGYILGDEGSGAVLGRKVLSNYFKRDMPNELTKKFDEEYQLSMGEAIENVYRKPPANRYLAGFSKFLIQNIEHPYIEKMVYDSFTEFFERNALRYENSDKLPIHFVGSIANYYKEVLEKVAEDKGVKIGKILKAPIDALVKYHSVPEGK